MTVLVGMAAATHAGPERWEKAINAFEAKDRANPPQQGGILFIGSSSILISGNISLYMTFGHQK